MTPQSIFKSLQNCHAVNIDVIPLTVPQTALIRDDWSWGPGSAEAELLRHAAKPISLGNNLLPSADPYLRDCRMAFMKHVLPKFRRPVAPNAAPSWQRQLAYYI